MRREDLPRLRPAATYALPRWKLVYVSNPKAACTSIKWILADLQELDPATFYKTLDYETTRATTIHRDRAVWTDQTPRLRRMTDAQLADITPDNGWLVFTATRHPASRLWSGWQSKVLLREPTFVSRFGEQEWFSRIPSSTDDVLEDWFRFIAHLREDPEPKVMQDLHFRPQARQLAIGRMPYDRVYDTTEFRVLLADLTEHLKTLGWDDELEVRRNNESPLPALAAAFPQDVLDVIQDRYKDDYDSLNYPLSVPPGLREETTYSADLLGTIGSVVERHERIGDVTRQARQLRRELAAAERRLRKLTPPAPPPTPPPPAPSVAARAAQRLPFFK